MHQKLVPDYFLVLANNSKQPLHVRNFILKDDYQQALKKLTLFFLLNPAPFSRQSYQKQKRPETSEELLFKLQNKFRKFFFELFQKLRLQIYARQLMTS